MAYKGIFSTLNGATLLKIWHQLAQDGCQFISVLIESFTIGKS